jgi:hypothetical protein
MDIKTLEKIVNNRARIARQWHGIGDPEAIMQFVAEQPDVKTPEAMKAVLDNLIKAIITADDAELAELARVYGVEIVNAVLRVTESIIRKSSADHDHD